MSQRKKENKERAKRQQREKREEKDGAKDVDSETEKKREAMKGFGWMRWVGL